MGDAQSQSPIPVPPVLLTGGRGDVEVDNHNHGRGDKSFSVEEDFVGISDINENPLVSFVESGDGDEGPPVGSDLEGEEEQIGISDQDEVPLVAVGETEEEEEEQFFSPDEFVSADNAVDWDMLMSRGGMHTQPSKNNWERNSLYVKFDPLIAAKREAADRMSFIFKAPKPPGPSTSMKSICENSSLFSETGSSFVSAREEWTLPMFEEVSSSPIRNNGIDQPSKIVAASVTDSEESSLSESSTAQGTENVTLPRIEIEEQSQNGHADAIDATKSPVCSEKSIDEKNGNGTTGTVGNVITKSPVCSEKSIHDKNGNGVPGTPGNVITKSPVCSEKSVHDKNGNGTPGTLRSAITRSPVCSEEPIHHKCNATFEIAENDIASAINEEGSPKDKTKDQNVKNVSFSMSMLADGLMNLNLIEDGLESDSDVDQRPHNITVSMNESSSNARTFNQSVPIIQEGSPNGINATGGSPKSDDEVALMDKALVNLNLTGEASLNDGFRDQNSNNGGGDSSHLTSVNANTKNNSIIETQTIETSEEAPTQSKSPAGPVTTAGGESNDNYRDLAMSAEQIERFTRITKLKEQLAELKLKDEEHKKEWEKRLARKESELSQKVKDYTKAKEKVEATEREFEKITQEHDKAVQDHRSMETMFSELYMTYDGFRKLENRFGENSSILEQREIILQQILKKREERDSVAQQEYQKVIETMKQDFEQILKEREDERLRLNAKARMSEMKTSKLESEIAQAEKVNEKMQVLFNDLVHQ